MKYIVRVERTNCQVGEVKVEAESYIEAIAIAQRVMQSPDFVWHSHWTQERRTVDIEKDK